MGVGAIKISKAKYNNSLNHRPERGPQQRQMEVKFLNIFDFIAFIEFKSIFED